MFIKDGVIYGDQSVTSLKIVSLKVLPDKIMLLTFNNGETRLFDATVLTGPAFAPLSEPEVFNHPELDHGVVTWKNGEIDCAPEYMYQNSYEYPMVG